MGKPSSRFTITAEGERRVFLSATEKKDGRLTLFLKPGVYSGRMGFTSMVGIQRQYYSLHDSYDSDENTTLHFTRIDEQGRKTDSSQVTDFYKKKSGFAFLYFSLAPNMAQAHYKLSMNDKAALYNIGEYDPNVFVFVHAVVVGAVDLEFPLPLDDSTNVREFKFKKYKIVLIWSFLHHKSLPWGQQAHVMTFPPEIAGTKELEGALRDLMKGRSASDCIWMYLNMRRSMTRHFIETSARNIGFAEKPGEIDTVANAMLYLREARTDTLEYQSRVRQMAFSLGQHGFDQLARAVTLTPDREQK